MDGYIAAAELAKVLGHPVRLRILDILARQEACVCHLATILHKRQAYVSQQLMRLREAGLVTDRREGVMVSYQLAEPAAQGVLAILRDVVRRREGDAVFAPVPEPPLAGCPCPRCQPAANEARNFRCS